MNKTTGEALKSEKPLLIVMLISLTTLLFVPFLIQFIGMRFGIYLSWFEVVLLGFLLFLFFNVAFISDRISVIKNINENVNNLIDPIKRAKYCYVANKEFARIEHLYHKLCFDKGCKEYFAAWYVEDMKALRKNMHNTRQKEIVSFDLYKIHNVNHPIYQLFNFDNAASDTEYAFCEICTYKDIKGWVHGDGEQFTKFIQGNVAKRENGVINGNIKHVKRIFIYDQNADKNGDLLTQLCFALHRNEVYEFKIIFKEKYDTEFNAIYTANGGGEKYEEKFALYGKTFAWEPMARNRHNEVINGIFSANKAKVNNYIDFFNKLWKSNAVEDYPITLVPIPYPQYSLIDLAKLYKDRGGAIDW